MAKSLDHDRVAHLIDIDAVEALDLMGPTVQLLTPPDEESAPCVMRGTIPPGGFIPLHSHDEPETFVAVSGDMEGLVQTVAGYKWLRIRAGDIFHVPGGARHAFRNCSWTAAVCIVISASRLGRFFRDAGTPVAEAGSSARQSADALRHYLETTARYGYWKGTPEENAQIGLSVSWAPDGRGRSARGAAG
jgi:quercetin dioxygenase-like cupin family protein